MSGAYFEAVWGATIELRFIRRTEYLSEQTGRVVHILQQKWMSTDGDCEWRDVPLVEEKT